MFFTSYQLRERWMPGLGQLNKTQSVKDLQCLLLCLTVALYTILCLIDS
jgi:hypothetical protein